VDNSGVILEHVDLIDVIEGLDTYSGSVERVRAGVEAYRAS
jgi:hypothetical protein